MEKFESSQAWFGLDPKFKDILLGNKVNKDLKKGTKVTAGYCLNI